MLPRAYWFIGLALCELGCVAQLDFTGLDAGAGTGGLSSFGGASALGGSPATGGTPSTGGTASTAGALSTGGIASTGSTIATGGVSHSGGTTTLVTVGGPDGGFSGLGGAINNSGGDSTLSCGISTVTAKPCDADADICESPVVLAANQDDPFAIAVDATYVYWTTSGEVKRVPLDGGTPTTIASGGPSSNIAVDAVYVYWTSYKEDSVLVMKGPLNGGTPIVLASVQGAVTDLTVNSTSIYLTSFAFDPGQPHLIL